MHPKLTKIDTSVVYKGWGNELVITNNSEFCGKLLTFRKGAEFSTHAHVLKYEVFYLLSGKVTVTGINTEDATTYELEMNPGDTINIPRFTFHRIKAVEESVIIEFSTHHEDSDSYRVIPGDSQKL